jgi:hypothetical protein
MPSFLSPVFGAGAQLFDNQGRVLAGGKIYTYLGGTTTPTATFTDNTDFVTNPNPIILDSAGRVPTEIWLEEEQTTKFVLTDSVGNVLGTWDQISGVNDITTFSTTTEWANLNVTPAYISATSFSVPGNLVSTLMLNRRLMISVTAGTIYAYITSSSFGSGITTVNVQPDSTALDSGISQVMVGLLKASPWSVPQQYLACNAAVTVPSATSTPIGAALSANVTVSGVVTITSFDTVVAGIVRLVKFSGALILTHNGTSLILPGAANITTAAGDQAIFRSLGSGNWECINYQRNAYGPDTIPAIPSGTRMTFNQTTAPTGWTKDTTAGLNDSIMRIVTGAVSSGGSQAFTTWNGLTATGAHTLITAEMPAHTHSTVVTVAGGAGYYGGNLSGGASSSNTSTSTGGDGSHTHPLTNGIKYNDFIIAAKD